MTLLPDCEIATAQAWLAAHPGINVISRDRGGGYGEAVARALRAAMQVADRWHLMENASSAFLDAVRKSMRAIRGAIGATTISPALLTSAEKLQYGRKAAMRKSRYALHTFGPRGSRFSCLASSRRMMRRYGAGSTAAAC